MKRYASLYWDFLLNRFKILMEYRVNFFIGASSTIFLQAASLAGVWAIMQKVPDIRGWTYDEILLVYGLITLAKSINHMFADNLWTFGRDYIRSGGFDRFLVRPVNPLFHLLADRFCHDGIGNFLVGVGLLVKASIGLGIAWTPLKLVYLAIAIVSGGVIFIGLNLITSAVSFWMTDSLPVMWAFFETHDFARYPLSIYGRSISILMTWVIPYGFTSFYPAEYILGRNPGVLAWTAPLVAAVVMTAGYQLWLKGLSRYSGTGS